VLDRLKLRWADGMIIDHEGFEITPSSPVLDPGLYDYKRSLPGEYCNTGMPALGKVVMIRCGIPLCAICVALLDQCSLHAVSRGAACIDILQSIVSGPGLRDSFWGVTPASFQVLGTVNASA